MSRPTPGLHHVTVLCGDARDNRAFHVDTLGQRLVKKTVNFDDPSMYHLYYGDGIGHPGTALTFFACPNAAPGTRGQGEARNLAWRVAPGALAFWAERLGAAGLDVKSEERFGESRLAACDLDGFRFSLVAQAVQSGIEPVPASPIPADAALGGFDGIDIASHDPVATASVLVDVLGYRFEARENAIARYRAGNDNEAVPRSVIDLHETGAADAGRPGRGSVHHIAFRAVNRAHQAALAEAAAATGLAPTPVIDRQYFESVYFREPGGVLFEIATDEPGFGIDEPIAALGEALKLPERYEPRRASIEAALTPL